MGNPRIPIDSCRFTQGICQDKPSILGWKFEKNSHTMACHWLASRDPTTVALWPDFPFQHSLERPWASRTWPSLVHRWDDLGCFLIPSGNLLHNYGKIHHVSWENSLFLWWFSIAMFDITRGYLLPTSCLSFGQMVSPSWYTLFLQCFFADLWGCGDGSKPWYLVNPKIAGKWMFIPLKMVSIGIDP